MDFKTTPLGYKRRPIKASMRYLQTEAEKDADLRQRMVEAPEWPDLRSHLSKFASADIVLAQMVIELEERLRSNERVLASFMIRMLGETPSLREGFEEWIANHAKDPIEAQLVREALDEMVGSSRRKGDDGSGPAT